MKRTEPAYILTCGRSRRFGSPKCMTEINSRPMLEIVTANLSTVFDEVYQVGKQAYGELPFVPDIASEQNPLTGIVTALRHCQSEWAFIIVCDLPLVDKTVLERLLPELTDDFQVVLPEVDGYFQYTCAFYNKSGLPLLEEKLGSGELALHQILREVNHQSVPFIDGRKFLNVNTRNELAVWEANMY